MKEKQNYEAPEMKVYQTQLNTVIAQSGNGITPLQEEDINW